MKLSCLLAAPILALCQACTNDRSFVGDYVSVDGPKRVEERSQQSPNPQSQSLSMPLSIASDGSANWSGIEGKFVRVGTNRGRLEFGKDNSIFRLLGFQPNTAGIYAFDITFVERGHLSLTSGTFTMLFERKSS